MLIINLRTRELIYHIESNESYDSNGGSEPSSFGGFEMLTPQVPTPGPQFGSSGQFMDSNPDDFAPIREMLDMPTNIDWV